MQNEKSQKFCFYTVKMAAKAHWSYFSRWLCTPRRLYWYDMSTVFGSAATPATFDSLPATLVNITCSLEGIPTTRVFRQLDDVPVMGLQATGEVGRLYQRYKKVCRDINVPLAPKCPNTRKLLGRPRKEQTWVLFLTLKNNLGASKKKS
jgi:hypothetical protein